MGSNPRLAAGALILAACVGDPAPDEWRAWVETGDISGERAELDTATIGFGPVWYAGPREVEFVGPPLPPELEEDPALEEVWVSNQELRVAVADLQDELSVANAALEAEQSKEKGGLSGTEASSMLGLVILAVIAYFREQIAAKTWRRNAEPKTGDS